MATILKGRRITQLVLFGQHLAVPHWSDLTQPTRIEVVKLLAQLLVGVQVSSPSRILQSRGGRDE